MIEPGALRRDVRYEINYGGGPAEVNTRCLGWDDCEKCYTQTERRPPGVQLVRSILEILEGIGMGKHVPESRFQFFVAHRFPRGRIFLIEDGRI